LRLGLARYAATALRAGSGLLARLAERLETRTAAATPAVAGSPERTRRLGTALFLLSLVLFLASRLVGLPDFPIYFFCDEAVNAVLASDLLRDNFRGQSREILPTYFPNAGFFNLSTSVYVQVVPVLLFGKSVFVTRATAVLLAFSGVIAVGLILKRIFRVRFPWAGILLLAVTPAWFLHSRTAFETSLAVVFYVWFLYFLLAYRDGRPRAFFPALLCGALAFYTYSPMQLVMVLTGALLFLSDLPFHWKNRRTAGWGAVLLLLLALPYARFLRTHPDYAGRHLQKIFSYWKDPKLSTKEKLRRYAKEYAIGLSPGYWYRSDRTRDLVRHRMKGYGHILPITLPFAAVGLFVCLRRFRSSPHRAVVLAALAAPAGGALVEVGVTRALAFVVPAALLTALGLEAVLFLLRRRIPEPVTAIALFLVLSALQVWMLRDALVNGPTWYRDYGLGGMQYGARQAFGEIRRSLAAGESDRGVLSPIWANGTNDLRRFFAGDDPRVELHNLDWYTGERRPLTAGTLVVLTEPEYQKAASEPRLRVVRLERTIPYPDGTPGFRAVRLEYPPDFEKRLAQERAARHALVSGKAALAGRRLEVFHSKLDMGAIGNIFDGDPRTLVRTERVNPAVVEVVFPSPRELSGIRVTTGSMDLRLTARLFGPGDGELAAYTREFRGLAPDPTVWLPFQPRAQGVAKLRIEVANILSGEFDHVHLRELRLE